MLTEKQQVCTPDVFFSKDYEGNCIFLGNIAVGIPPKRRYNKVCVAFRDKR